MKLLNNFFITTLYLIAMMYGLLLAIFLLPLIGDYESEVIVSNEQEQTADDVVANQSANITRVRFTGDIMLGRYVESLMNAHGRFYPYRGIFFDEVADYTFINFESAMASVHKHTPNFNFQFSTNPKLVPGLKLLSVTHASLSNNHGYDYGFSGYSNTIFHLKENGIKAFGHPRQVSNNSYEIIRTAFGDVAVFAINVVGQEFVSKDFIEQFKGVENSTKMQIVYIHWGEEYEAVHNLEQRNLAKELIANGVDLIIGHHPHVVQDIEIIDGVLVFYSLGNFIFDQYFSDEVQTGLVVDLVLSSNEVKFSLVPVTAIGSKSQPRLMNMNESKKFLENLAERSNEKVKEMIINNSILSPSITN